VPARPDARLSLAAALAAALAVAQALPACAGHRAAAPAAPGAAPLRTPAAVAVEARDADRAMSAASAARDPDAFIGHVAPDALFLAGRVTAGRAAVGIEWAERLTPGGPLLTWEPDRAEAAGSGDLVLTGGTWRWLEAGETDPAKAGTGRYFTVWRREPDGLLRAVLDGGDRPVPPLPAAVVRRPLRTFTSADGALSAEGGLLLEGEREVGWYAVVRQGAGAGAKVLLDSARYKPAP
jgi:ketosteroid isomerase-like protein